MAFRDENGKITIDEIAAASDIKHIEAAKEHLKIACNLLTTMNNKAIDFSGKTGTSVSDACIALQKHINKLLEAGNVTQKNIECIVKKYERIDSDLKELVNNGGN